MYSHACWVLNAMYTFIIYYINLQVIKTTGFMKGLFTESEMNSDNVKDRDSKIAFLQKAIDLTCNTILR